MIKYHKKRFDGKIQPCFAQIEALEELQKTLEEEYNKSLVVMATGLGKTYLAGFFAQNFERILFIEHRVYGHPKVPPLPFFRATSDRFQCHLCHFSEPLRTDFSATSAMVSATSCIINLHNIVRIYYAGGFFVINYREILR